MNKKRIVFRADGGPNIGMGHVTRLLAFAGMLDNSFSKVFATISESSSVIEMINNSVDEVILLNKVDDHYNEFLNYLTGEEIVVLDNYYFNTEYQRLIRNLGCALVCVDDMHDKHYVADIVINHAPGLDPEMFSCEKHTKLCLGPDFALLRKPFLDYAGSREVVENRKSVFVCFGGSDNFNLTQKVLNVLIEIEEIDQIFVVTGSQYRDTISLLESIKGIDYIDHFSDIDAYMMSDLLTKSHLAIVPASSILLEVLCFNIQIITGYYAENQRNILKGLADADVVSQVGDFREVDGKVLRDFCVQRLNFMTGSDRGLIDGKSAGRIASLFNRQ